MEWYDQKQFIEGTKYFGPVIKKKIDNEHGDFIFGFCKYFLVKLMDYFFTITDEESHYQ